MQRWPSSWTSTPSSLGSTDWQRRGDPAAAGSRAPRPQNTTTPAVARQESTQASFVIAITMPISTNTTIATCIQIQVGDMTRTPYSARPYRHPRGSLRIRAGA